MNMQEIIRTVKAFSENFQIPLSHIRVTHGSAMVMLGLLKETADVDMVIHTNDFYDLINMGHDSTPVENGQEYVKINTIDIYTEYNPNYDWGKAPHLHGVHLETGEETLAQYKRLNRPKDQDKIKILNANHFN